MRIRINDIPDEGLTIDVALDRAFLTDALVGVGADLERSRAAAHLELTRGGENIFARGRLWGHLAVPCCRCLATAELKLDIPLQMTFAPEKAGESDGPVEEDVAYATHDGREVVLDALLREAVILTVPMTALCRADCKGLCPVCGQDRNMGTCDCVPPPDPRLSALHGLKT